MDHTGGYSMAIAILAVLWLLMFANTGGTDVLRVRAFQVGESIAETVDNLGRRYVMPRWLFAKVRQVAARRVAVVFGAAGSRHPLVKHGVGRGRGDGAGRQLEG